MDGKMKIKRRLFHIHQDKVIVDYGVTQYTCGVYWTIHCTTVHLSKVQMT